jgi:hypothetical protein
LRYLTEDEYQRLVEAAKRVENQAEAKLEKLSKENGSRHWTISATELRLGGPPSPRGLRRDIAP